MKNERELIGIKILRTFCPARLLEEVEGDLLQRYQREKTIYGERRAARRLLWNAIRYFRWEVLRRRKQVNQNRLGMIQNYLKIAFRNFSKQRSYTLLNATGLTLGVVASLLIFQYVKYERSFDRFHHRASDIYRIQYNWWHDGKLNFESAVAVPMAPRAMKENFPEVEEFTRLFPVNGVMRYIAPDGKEVKFYEEKMQFADTSFFKVFDFGLVSGDRATALKGIDKALISETAARRYFGNEDPIGKKIERNGRRLYEITGVFKSVPANSHIRFEFLLSYETLNQMTEGNSETSWGWYDFYCYVLLRPGTDAHALQQKWDTYLAEVRKEFWTQRNGKQEFILRPMTDIHLNSRLLYEAQPSDLRDGGSVYALGIIAIFILIIAWVNYINLATARSFSRANEVGVRKVMGAVRDQLIGQFMTESLLLNLFAIVIGVIISVVLWKPFSEMAGWPIPLDYMLETEFWMILGAVFLLGTFLSGFYPAIVLSSFKPVEVLKGKVMRLSGGQTLRRALVVFQFAASVFLIAGSIIVFQQVEFMKKNDLGVNIEKTLVLKGPGITDSTFRSRLDAFRIEATRVPGIKSLTAASNVPGDEIFWTNNVSRIKGASPQILTESNVAIDYDYVEAFGLRMVAGRSFDRNFPGDEKRALVNRAMSQALGYREPSEIIGESIQCGGDTLEVIGVLEDYHQMSLKSRVAPIIFHLAEETKFIALKIQTNDHAAVLAAIEKPWNQQFPGNPMDYFFLDEFFNKQYEKDERFSSVFNLFTGLAILIASLGLFGLASFMAMQRTKEIGIRKVLGSSVPQIVLLLSRSFLGPVLIANLIAWPLAGYAMQQWLLDFPYHISINFLIFPLAGLVVVTIAMISVSSQTLKAALTKPAETLKYE